MMNARHGYLNFTSKFFALLFGAIFLCSIPNNRANAAELFEFYTGVRSLGMGGVSIAVVNDETALLTNPAALGKLRDYFITIADPELSLSQNSQKIFDTDIFAFRDPQELLGLLNSNPDIYFHQKAQVFPSIVFPNFGFGVLGKWETNAEVVSSTSNYRLDYTSDYAALIGYSFRFFDGRFKLGFNIKAINRAEIAQDLATTSTGLTLDNLVSEGLGIGSDVGFILTMPWAYLPTLAVVYRDVGGTKYDVEDGFFFSEDTTRPEKTDATLDVALAMFPIMGKRTRTTISIEYRDVLYASRLEEGEEEDSLKRAHAGFEINVADAFFFRGGMNQRYWTVGVELAMMNYQLQLASYGEEIGTVDTSREDRRYVAKFAYRF